MKPEQSREHGESKCGDTGQSRPNVTLVTLLKVAQAGEAPEGQRVDIGRWQIPIFLLGLLASLLTLWWQPWRMWGKAANWSVLVERAVNADEAGDLEQARLLAQEILTGQAPEQFQAIAKLVLVGALLADIDQQWLDAADWLDLLDSGGIQFANTALPEDVLKRIAQLLESIPTQALPRELVPRWAYRKLWFQVLRQEAPADWPQRLEQLLQENPSERPRGYERLVRYHLHRLAKQPNRSLEEQAADWEAALQANKQLLLQPDLPSASTARLRQALLLLKLGRYAEAREVVARIRSGDPHYCEALYVLGQIWWAEERFEEAAQAWNRLNETAPPNWPRLPRVLYWLGVCYIRSGQPPEEAERVWQQLLERYPQATWERQGSLLGLAVLRHGRASEGEVLGLLRQALGSPWEDNPYLRPPHAEEALHRIWQDWMTQNRFGAAQELARLWLSSGKDSLAGKRWLALALSRQADVTWQRQADGEELSSQDVAAMQSAYREAGELFEELARSLADSTHKDRSTGQDFKQRDTPSSATTHSKELRQDSIDYLYQAALCFQRAQDLPRAIRLLEQALTDLDKGVSVPRSTSENDNLRQAMLVMLGECWYQLKLPQKAVEALQRALLLPGPQRVRGYYQLALALMELGKLDEAERALREVLTVSVANQEAPELRKALSALGHLHFRREQYETAAEYLDKAISRYSADSPSAYSLRYWLGESYRLAGRQEDRKAVAADTETRREFHRQQKRKYLQRAIEVFDSLAQSLLLREKKQPLSAELALLLRESRFALADSYFNLGEYEKSAQLFESLGREYDRQLAGLRAWFEARRCYLAAHRAEEALRAIDQARLILEHLSDQDLAPTRMTRQQWIQFLEEARQKTRLPQ